MTVPRGEGHQRDASPGWHTGATAPGLEPVGASPEDVNGRADLEILVAVLATELKSLVSHGAGPKRLRGCPTLLRLVAGRHPGKEGRDLLVLARRELEGAAIRLGYPRTRAARLLTRLAQDASSNADVNRERAIEVMASRVTPRAFRRDGDELDLMLVLARELVAGDSPGTAWTVDRCDIETTKLGIDIRVHLIAQR